MATVTTGNYEELLRKYAPRPIRNERTYKVRLRQVEQLMKKPKLSRAESDLLELLATLVEQYESIEHPTPTSTPDQMLAHLIEAKEVRPTDVAKATGIPRSTISAVLAGRRQMSKANIAALSVYFGVSPAVLFGNVK